MYILYIYIYIHKDMYIVYVHKYYINSGIITKHIENISEQITLPEEGLILSSCYKHNAWLIIIIIII